MRISWAGLIPLRVAALSSRLIWSGVRNIVVRFMAAVYSKCIRCQEESRVRAIIFGNIPNPHGVSGLGLHDMIFLSAIVVSVFVLSILFSTEVSILFF